jgi:hypothetical protein
MAIDFLEPYLRGEKGYEVIEERDDIEEITERIKRGESPPVEERSSEEDESDFDEEDFDKEVNDVEDEDGSLSSSDEEQITPEVISTILTEAQYLMSYTESCYIQTTSTYDINTIEEIRNLAAQISLLKVNLESQLNKGDKQ